MPGRHYSIRRTIGRTGGLSAGGSSASAQACSMRASGISDTRSAARTNGARNGGSTVPAASTTALAAPIGQALAMSLARTMRIPIVGRGILGHRALHLNHDRTSPCPQTSKCGEHAGTHRWRQARTWGPGTSQSEIAVSSWPARVQETAPCSDPPQPVATIRCRAKPNPACTSVFED